MKKYPSVTIAMAVYKPDKKFFIKQLQSINNQDYPNVSLLIWNDSPEDKTVNEIANKYISDIPYQIKDNGRNNGVTQVFARLTEHVTSKYIAYSDQDDVWMPNKISVMVKFLEKHSDCTCCHSDICDIDEEGTIIRKTRYPAPLELINTKKYQCESYLVKNWCAGCAMVMPTKIARAALPFPKLEYHDVWLATYAASVGNVCYLKDCLIQHRIHTTNNSGILHGIETSENYYSKKLDRDSELVKYIETYIQKKELFQSAINWIHLREDYANHPTLITAARLLSKLKIRPCLTLFEILLPLIPKRIFSTILKMIRKEVNTLGIR